MSNRYQVFDLHRTIMPIAQKITHIRSFDSKYMTRRILEIYVKEADAMAAN